MAASRQRLKEAIIILAGRRGTARANRANPDNPPHRHLPQRFL
jgi:hypothetical protein